MGYDPVGMIDYHMLISMLSSTSPGGLTHSVLTDTTQEYSYIWIILVNFLMVDLDPQIMVEDVFPHLMLKRLWSVLSMEISWNLYHNLGNLLTLQLLLLIRSHAGHMIQKDVGTFQEINSWILSKSFSLHHYHMKH